MKSKVCDYFSFLLLNYCAIPQNINDIHQRSAAVHPAENSFEIIHQWEFLNYTWPTYWSYKNSLENFQYVPENNAPTGMKIYGSKIFLSIPRTRPGIPATLAYVSLIDAGTGSNELLHPFPNWKMNIYKGCRGFQSVQSMEIDKSGYMWVIDGVRNNALTTCPAKLVILDLKNGGKIAHVYNFPNEVAMSRGGFLNDIVLDDVDGGHAYITDNSIIDPGLIVYCLKKNRSWKLRDISMFPELKAAGFRVKNSIFNNLAPIDGIALSPVSPVSPENPTKSRTLFYCALTGFNLYGIDTQVIRNESEIYGENWRKNVVLIGKKEAQSDGLMMDNEGNLYYTLLPLNGVGKWNINQPLSSSKIIYKDGKKMIWPDTFAMDENGFLYVISNNIQEFVDLSNKLTLTGEIKFRIFRYYTGTKSYMY